MYSRYPNYRFSSGVKLPENYSGNAFKTSDGGEAEGVREVAEEISVEKEIEREVAEDESVPAVKVGSKGLHFPGFKFDIGRIFSGGFGFEEILIIGLILLISQNGKGDDDIILLLALLLFIG